MIGSSRCRQQAAQGFVSSVGYSSFCVDVGLLASSSADKPMFVAIQ